MPPSSVEQVKPDPDSDLNGSKNQGLPQDPEKAQIFQQTTSLDSDPFLVKFAEPHDAENPKDWPAKKKYIVTAMIGAGSANRIMVSTVLAPALNAVATDLHITSSVESVMTLSAFLIATAFAPLLFGPLSELYGRKPILLASNVWFLIWNLVCGFAQTSTILIVARMFAGIGASAVYVLGYGVLSDVWRAEQRGRSMAVYTVVMLMAPAFGPILGGYVTQYTTWRWTFWSTSALIGAMIVLETFLFHESYPATILYHRAQKIRKDTGDSRYYTATERLDEGRTVSGVLVWSLTRPLRLLIFHPIIQFFTIYTGYLYGILYLILSSYSTLWVKQYHENEAQSSLHYIASALGELVGAQVGAPLMDATFRKLKARAGGAIAPEYHLPLVVPGIVLIACGFVIFGWSAQYRVFWLVVDIGCFIVNFGMQLASSAMQGYILDAYPDHASSASAASQVLRSLAAFGFPLFAPAMYTALGYGWGNTLIALVSITIGLVSPLFIWKYGATLRASARSTH